MKREGKFEGSNVRKVRVFSVLSDIDSIRKKELELRKGKGYREEYFICSICVHLHKE